jgi:glycosyltransferase involved in cell wall biosynthesis
MKLLNKTSIQVTVLIPTKNEELTISKFIDWVHEGFRISGVNGEIVLADSSIDLTAEIAKSKGARVIPISSDGLGRAYRESAHYVNGKYVIVGDADCTYDFRDLKPFIQAFDSGYEFVMGNRFKGRIDRGSMPILHRYFGTPFTSWIFRRILKLPFSDIHCGMRGVTADLLKKLPFDEAGWEYAPEMIIQACNRTKNFTEVPINFLKEPDGRVSHFKRGKLSFFAPFKAGFGAVRVTVLHSLDKVFYKLGLLFSILGTTLVIILTPGPISVRNLQFSLITQILGFILGAMGWLMYCFSKFMVSINHNASTIDKIHNRILLNFSLITSLLFCLGIVIGFQALNFFKFNVFAITDFNRNVIILNCYLLTNIFISLLFNLIENYLSLSNQKTRKNS